VNFDFHFEWGCDCERFSFWELVAFLGFWWEFVVNQWLICLILWLKQKVKCVFG
jgi:hypothetical protein